MPKIALQTTVFFGFFLASTVVRASDGCPWLNAATASWLLGGEVRLTVSSPNPHGDVTCEFSSGQAPGLSSLQIAVHTMETPSQDFRSLLSQCDWPQRPVKALGTDAAQCVMKQSAHLDEEEIIARVRERAFVVVVRRAGTSAAVPRDGLRDDTRNVAEQVAASLF